MNLTDDSPNRRMIDLFSRVPEPELMEAPEQVDAYAETDFSEPHNVLIDELARSFPGEGFAGPVLNLGCGSGDDTFRFLARFPASRVTAVDGSALMIERARHDLKEKYPRLAARADFRVAYIPGPEIPRLPYLAIISNSLLHHFHNPAAFWQAVRELARPGTLIFVSDLRRPAGLHLVDALVERYAGNSLPIQRADFRNSLCAAFLKEEVEAQIAAAGFTGLTVEEIGDRHLRISGQV